MSRGKVIQSGHIISFAPEMRQHADTADAESADVYSLAKTLWSLAGGRPDPPMGELRRDRAELQISTNVTDPRASLLEPLLERCTAGDPMRRPKMQVFADELTWWFEPPVATSFTDLSSFADEAQRLRDANRFEHAETNDERLTRLYNEAIMQVHGLQTQLMTAMTHVGLDNVGSRSKNIEGWPPEDYGGSGGLPCWGINTVASPWIAANIGVVHRSQPATDLEDMAVTVILAIMTADSQQNYIDEFKRFHPGSLRLDQIISELVSQITEMLPRIVADFLTSCRQAGIPQMRNDG